MPGTVTLLNRWMGPSVDGLQLDCADTGILPFHHGMKSMNNSCARKYGFEFKVSGVDGWRRDGWSSCMEDPRCAVRRRDPATVPRARALLKLSRKESTATSVISGLFAPIPRFDLGPCIAANMSCDPLDDDPALPAAEVPYRSAFDYEATWRVGEAAAAQWPDMRPGEIGQEAGPKPLGQAECAIPELGQGGPAGARTGRQKPVRTSPEDRARRSASP